MDYQVKLQRHASREIDLYWPDFQKSSDYTALMQDPDFAKIPPQEIRSILVTFFPSRLKICARRLKPFRPRRFQSRSKPRCNKSTISIAGVVKQLRLLPS